MATHPIPFKPLMVRALLREIEAPGTGKTQTRRVMDPQPRVETLASEHLEDYELRGWLCIDLGGADYAVIKKKLWSPGDLLWVREAWRTHAQCNDLSPSQMGGEEPVRFECDGTEQTHGWPAIDRMGRYRPGMFMPQWASRITCRVTDVRVQRVQEISEADAIAEGAYVGKASGRVADDYGSMAVAGQWFSTARAWYADLWDRINGPGAWARNDWVIATTFQPIAKNVSEVTP